MSVYVTSPHTARLVGCLWRVVRSC